MLFLLGKCMFIHRYDLMESTFVSYFHCKIMLELCVNNRRIRPDILLLMIFLLSSFFILSSSSLFSLFISFFLHRRLVILLPSIYTLTYHSITFFIALFFYMYLFDEGKKRRRHARKKERGSWGVLLLYSIRRLLGCLGCKCRNLSRKKSRNIAEHTHFGVLGQCRGFYIWPYGHAILKRVVFSHCSHHESK